LTYIFASDNYMCLSLFKCFRWTR